MAKNTPSAPVQHPGFAMPVYSIAARPREGRGRVLLAWVLALAALGGGAWLLRDAPALLSGLLDAAGREAGGLWSAARSLIG